MDMIARGDGPIADDLRRVRARADLGLGLADALATWPTERSLPSVRATAGALALASAVGGGAADALEGLSISLRERSGAVAEARALSAQARVSAIVVGAGPVGYLALSALLDPRSFDTLAGTAPGRTCLAIGLALDGAALLWMRRIVRVGDAE
jgi:tight adherence protein B